MSAVYLAKEPRIEILNFPPSTSAAFAPDRREPRKWLLLRNRACFRTATVPCSVQVHWATKAALVVSSNGTPSSPPSVRLAGGRLLCCILAICHWTLPDQLTRTCSDWIPPWVSYASISACPCHRRVHLLPPMPTTTSIFRVYTYHLDEPNFYVSFCISSRARSRLRFSFTSYATKVL
jgi:hypothetical protein